MNYQTLLYEQDGHVVTLTYNRPDQHNAVNGTMNSELHHAWERFRDDEEAFVLVITGAGESSFCAGWDLADAASLGEIGDYDAYRVGLYNSPGECGKVKLLNGDWSALYATTSGGAKTKSDYTSYTATITVACP